MRSELGSLLTVLAVPAAVALVFPYSAIGFKPVEKFAPKSAFVSYVVLDAAAEVAAVKAAKTSWREADDGVARMRAELSLGELPEPVPEPVMDISAKAPLPSPLPVVPGRTGYLPSLAAAGPDQIPAMEPQAAEPVFSRREMLEIK